MAPSLPLVELVPLIAIGAYLLGSIPWSYLIVKRLQGRDVRTVGSGNAGATNVMRAAGKAAGAAALVLDLAKGVGAVAGARALGAPEWLVGVATLAVVAGHIFPIFLGWRGGKGVATAAGAFATLAPGALAVAVGVFVAVVAWKRYISLGSVAAAAAFPVALAAGEGLGWIAPGGAGREAACAAAAVLIIVRHAGNLRRLRAGVEPRLDAPRLDLESPSEPQGRGR
jgi:glycerol-3-phosphate acyltransferase PlsY